MDFVCTAEWLLQNRYNLIECMYSNKPVKSSHRD
jgi:hypothetical protein